VLVCTFAEKVCRSRLVNRTEVDDTTTAIAAAI